MKVLVTLPNHDTAVNCISEWNKKLVVPLAEKKAETCDVLKGKNVTKAAVEHKIKETGHNLLLFNGHGSLAGDSICGHENEEIVKLGKNDGILDSKIVHSFTCCSARQLGRKSKAKALALLTSPSK